MNRRFAFFAVVLAAFMVLCPSVFAQQTLDRSRPPEVGPPPRLDLPEIQRFTLTNGLPVLLMEKHDVPLVQVNLLVEAGRVNEPISRRGLASLTADMLDEGAGDYDALELADAIAFLGADLQTGAGLHTASVDLHTPLSKLDAALSLLADVALRPTFPENELERLRTERLTDLIQAYDEPRAVAPLIFDRTLFGVDHPYGAPTNLEAPLRSLSRDELHRFYETYFRPNNATLIVVGDVTPAMIQPKLEAAFGAWEPGDVTAATVAEVPQVQNRTIYLVDKPGAEQSVIRIGRIGAARSTEDFYALEVMNTILGGSFSSRLNQNLRETHGYSYGAGSGFGYRPIPGPFTAASDVQTDVTGPALTEFMNELTGMLEPVPEEELDRAKSYTALQYPPVFQSVRGIAGELEDLVLYDLPESYFENYIDGIMAVTQDDVQRVARQYLDPDNLAIIVVGDRATIEAPIRALNLGEVKVYSVIDVLGPVPVLDEGSQ